MEEWKEYKLGELIELNNGFAFKSKDFVTSGIPVIKIKNVKANRILLEDVSYVSMETAQNIKCNPIMPSDILITMTGNRKDGSIDSWVGKVALFNHEGLYLLNQRVSAIRIKYPDIVDYRYLAYYLSSFESQLYFINHSNSSGGQANISPEIVNNYIVNLPSFQTQKRISDLLKTLDDKIELNRRINGNLEQQAQALFKAWFVDFEPFKDGKFVDSELGRIPEGWKVGRFNNIIESTLSGDWGKERQEGNYIKKVFCLRGADIPDVKTGNKGYMPIRFILEKNFATKALTAGNLVIEISGGSPTQSTGRICRISHELLTKYNNSIVCTNFCKAIRPMVGYSSFMYYMWEKLYNEEVMFSYENGTTGIKNLDINGLTQKEPIIIPPIEVALNFEKYVDIYYNKIQKNGIESEQLSHLRDTLLPRLMSGELNVNTITE